MSDAQLWNELFAAYSRLVTERNSLRAELSNLVELTDKTVRLVMYLDMPKTAAKAVRVLAETTERIRDSHACASIRHIRETVEMDLLRTAVEKSKGD